jgi:hypothetical protein
MDEGEENWLRPQPDRVIAITQLHAGRKSFESFIFVTRGKLLQFAKP